MSKKLIEINGSDREKALVRAANHLIHTYSGVDGNDTDEDIDNAFDSLVDALSPYVREELGLPAT